MVDLKNKNLIKIMWLPGEDEILFNMRNEKSLPLNSKLYSHIANYINTSEWKDLYKEEYSNWLNKDSESIYDINNAVNLMMTKALPKVNEILENEMIFYWFDIDRTYNENFKWEYCPISKKKLIYLGDDYPKPNSFISPDYPLVFPSI